MTTYADRLSTVARSRLGTVLGATAISQGLNAVSMIALPLLASAPVADLYAVGLQVGPSAYGGFVLGVTYNMAIGRPGFGAWRRSAAVAAALSLVVAGIAIATMAGQRTSVGTSDILAVALFGVGGAALAIAATKGVRLACLGSPSRLSAVGIAPAVALLIGLVAARITSCSWVLPAALWAVVCVLLAVAYARIPAQGGRSVVTQEPNDRPGLHALGLSLGVLVSTVVPVIYVSALTGLESGTTALAFIVMRIGTSVVTLAVNSILLARYEWGSPQRKLGGIFAVGGFASLFGVGLAGPLWLAGEDGVTVAVLAVTWLLLIVTTPFALREANARRMAPALLVKVAIDLAFACGGAAVLLTHPSVVSFFGLLIVSQVVTQSVLAFAFGARRAGTALVAGTVGSVLVSLAPLIGR